VSDDRLFAEHVRPAAGTVEEVEQVVECHPVGGQSACASPGATQASPFLARPLERDCPTVLPGQDDADLAQAYGEQGERWLRLAAVACVEQRLLQEWLRRPAERLGAAAPTPSASPEARPPLRGRQAGPGTGDSLVAAGDLRAAERLSALRIRVTTVRNAKIGRSATARGVKTHHAAEQGAALSASQASRSCSLAGAGRGATVTVPSKTSGPRKAFISLSWERCRRSRIRSAAHE
jgi:hypothetical protein